MSYILFLIRILNYIGLLHHIKCNIYLENELYLILIETVYT